MNAATILGIQRDIDATRREQRELEARLVELELLYALDALDARQPSPTHDVVISSDFEPSPEARMAGRLALANAYERALTRWLARRDAL